MENAKLQRWAELLLDTGKRNNLINFKNRYSSVCDVVYPDAENIFASAIADASFSVYNLANEERRDLYNDELDDESNKEAFLAAFSPRVNKANTLLVYTAGEKTERTFRNIYKKSKSVLQETGVNIAYIAFGFINWKDGSESLFAPLLLLPVVFSPFGVGKLPEIEILESEITVNPSFAYKCECEYGIKLPEYVFGTGLNDYLELVKERVEPIGWFVTKECKISTFSFLKINMYRDIEDNAELITQNQNIRVLLGEGSSCYDFSAEGDKRLSNVIDADNSQEQAIRAVLNGQSIVLQGPPGTGKSQTITNMIAECMANGKTVLFVSEKLAALNVVYEKLKNAGLNELCLELHSHKANKKDLIAEICNCLKSEKCRLNAKAEGVLARREEEEKGLNAYVDKLHQKQPNIEKSLYELINCYFDCGCDIDVKYSISNIGLKNEGYLYEAVNLMEEYVAYQDVIGVDYRKNCWYGYNNPDSSYSALNKTERAINDLVPILASVKNIKGQLKEKYSIEAKSLSQLNAVGKLLTFLAKSKIINEKIIPQPRYVCDRAGALNEISKKIKEKRGLLLTHFNPSILLVDSEQTQKLIQSLNDGSSLVARVFGKKYKEVTQFLALHAKSNNPLKDKASVYSVVNILREYNLLLSLFNENVGDMAEILGENFSSFDTDWNAVINEITKYRAYLSFDLTGRLGDLNSEEYALAKSDFELLGAQLTQKCALQGEIYHLVLNYDSEILNFYNFNVDRLYEIILDCKNNIEQLRSWCAFLGANNRAKGLGVSDFIDFYLDQNLPLADMPRVYKWVFYFNYIEYIISSNPELEGFSRILQDRRVKNFVKTDKECLDVNKAIIRARMSDKKPSLASVSPESQIAMILHEGEKKRMQKSIRNLLAEGCEVIQTLKPCFLMSPLSVSTFLTGGRMSFDVVVFDEASQIFPQDAIGAIYRGKQLVVVGDSKQMPPSDFFMNTVTGAIEEEGAEEDISDYESVLDICSACFAQKSLRWHYRSKYESLIAFSNKYFYDGNLITFPSPAKEGKDVGVDYYNAGGVYEQNSRINRAEAEKVAELVFEHFDKYPTRSLGVVAFNMAQQEYIEKVITAKRASKRKYDKFFAEDKKEYFFVKNLETVQGDERDTIIFSIAYAKNTAGKFIHNFGPLNHKGGERRLNVAVTRAKINVKIVCSITADDIDLNRTSAEGAKLLKAYLAYAQAGGEYVEVDGLTECNGIEKQVCDFLNKNGYSTSQKIGCSTMKIDIGVKGQNGNFIMAIECDGESYKNGASARDRDRLRPNVLKSMGWNYYRIWSVDWYKNPASEKKLLLLALEKAKQLTAMGGTGQIAQAVGEKAKEYNKDTVMAIPADINVENIPVDSEETDIVYSEDDYGEFIKEQFIEQDMTETYGFAVYDLHDLSMAFAANGDNYLLAVKEILKYEAPLSEDWLMRRSLPIFEKSVLNAATVNMINDLLSGCESEGIIRKNGFLYLEGVSEYKLRMPSHVCRRHINAISLEELASGLFAIICHYPAIDKNGLFITLSYRLGIRKMNGMVYGRMEKALMLLVDKIEIENAFIRKKAE